MKPTRNQQKKRNRTWLTYKNQQNYFSKHEFPNAWRWKKQDDSYRL